MQCQKDGLELRNLRRGAFLQSAEQVPVVHGERRALRQSLRVSSGSCRRARRAFTQRPELWSPTPGGWRNFRKAADRTTSLPERNDLLTQAARLNDARK
ncbi:hypothetical protein DAT35_55435 [Vitiosangium sp. GDMCC 1.1324]|nr:hypothetical protein DAT35_55435 [Vitiosangium sp. GDMCC 1.1324]